MKRAIIGLLLVAAIGAGAGAYYIRRSGPEVQVQTSPITRGEIIDAVAATGTLQAVTTVQVGSQVSGNISFLGADFNSIVKKDQVIARLDPSLFEAQLQQSKANLVQSQANLVKAQSDLDRAKVMVTDAQQKYTRAKELAAKSLLPQSDLDAAKIALDSAVASVASQDATVKQSQAQVAQSQASVYQNQVNLDHTVIQAPIDGIVTQRSVDVGQTVAASMTAPQLFILAADLTKMQVSANIDESDVGRVRPAQDVTFRVDAYPGVEFRGTVAQVRLNPIVVNNVTTYATMINVPNDDLRLKPGMTANLKIQIARRADALRIPNTALRFRPTIDMFTALNQAPPPEALGGGRGRGGRGGRGDQATAGAAAQPTGTAPAAPAGAASAPQPNAPADAAGRSSGGRGGDQSGDRGQQRLDRFKAMSADEQKQFIARMKDRGQDTSAFEKLMAPAKGSPAKASATGKTAAKGADSAFAFTPKYGSAQSGQTIDALFGPVPTVETRGRAWIFVDHQLKPVAIRLGITDGSFTELLGDAIQPPMEVVITVTGLGSTRATSAAGNGNPLMPAQRGGPGGIPGGGGPGRGR